MSIVGSNFASNFSSRDKFEILQRRAHTERQAPVTDEKATITHVFLKNFTKHKKLFSSILVNFCQNIQGLTTVPMLSAKFYCVAVS